MRRRQSAHAVVFAALLLAALPQSVAAQEDVIRKLITVEYDKAENAGDVAAKMLLYAPDAVLLPPQGPIVSGEAAVRAWHVTSYKEAKLQVTSTVREVRMFGDAATVTGTYSGTMTPAAGGAPQKLTGKFLTLVRRQKDGSWKIAQEIWNTEPPPK